MPDLKEQSLVFLNMFLTNVTFFVLRPPLLSNFTVNKNIVVIIPDAWSSAADWSYGVPKLEAAGNEVIVVNLAGHETDTAPVAAISLQGYAYAISFLNTSELLWQYHTTSFLPGRTAK